MTKSTKGSNAHKIMELATYVNVMILDNCIKVDLIPCCDDTANLSLALLGIVGKNNTNCRRTYKIAVDEIDARKVCMMELLSSKVKGNANILGVDLLIHEVNVNGSLTSVSLKVNINHKTDFSTMVSMFYKYKNYHLVTESQMIFTAYGLKVKFDIKEYDLDQILFAMNNGENIRVILEDCGIEGYEIHVDDVISAHIHSRRKGITRNCLLIAKTLNKPQGYITAFLLTAGLARLIVKLTK
jgi:hypothetical protein